MVHHSISTNDIYSITKSVALIANGALNNYPLILPIIKQYDKCIAVDGGLIHCKEMNITPDLIIGDFDSIPPELMGKYPNIPKMVYPTEKDQTDLELALATVDIASMEKIGIFAAMEKRTDHAMANLHLLGRYPNKVVIETERETLFSITGKSKIHCRQGQTLSLIPIGSNASGVTTHGLKWELNDATINKDFMSISNICLGSYVDISIANGDLLCCLIR